MGRFDEKYSEPLRRAVGSYLIDPDPLTQRRRTVPMARAALMAGQLRDELGQPVPMPPEAPPTSTFYNFKRREEQRRKGELLSPLARQALEDPEAVREQFIRRAVSAHEYTVEKLEDTLRKGKIDSRLHGMVVKNTPTILAVLKQAKGNNKPKPQQHHKDEPNPQDDPAATPDALAELVTAHEQSAKGVAA